jgi:hypothetical protein
VEAADAEDRSVTVREQCRQRRNGEPCIKTYAADMVTVTATHECVGWCPTLQKLLDLDEPVQQEAAE